MKNKMSTFMFCREDVMCSGKETLTFSPAQWYERYIPCDRVRAGVRHLFLKFREEFDLYEEYSFTFKDTGKTDFIYRVYLKGKGGELGFLFQRMLLDDEPQLFYKRAEKREQKPICRIEC
jgi:hypothetical protein